MLLPSSKGLSLHLYDNLNDTRPKHEIDVKNIQIEKNTSKFVMLSRNAVPFTVYTRSRKFYLATSTGEDFTEWMAVLQPAERQVSPAPSNHQGPYAKSRRDDSDARSVYSVATHGADEDDTMSVVSASSRGTMAMREDASVGSNLETLSFSSEPVLTPYELSVLGQEHLPDEEKLPGNAYMKRRGTEPLTLIPAPTSTEFHEKIEWHKKFVEILDIRTITEEQALQKGTPGRLSLDVQLMEHVGAFQERAATHARQLIDEYHISGGVSVSASDYKMGPDRTFLKDGIVMRFACDYDSMLQRLTVAASYKQIEDALFKTSAELRAVNATIKAVASNASDAKPFYTILMALVDYKGFRIVAHADPSPSTKMVSVHDLHPKRLKIDELVCTETQPIGHALNLTSHTVQVNDDRRVRVELAATVEVHVDTLSNRTYLTCLRDIFPVDYYTPEAVGLRAIQQGAVHPNMLHRLRPEFLSVYQNAICADALTPTSGATRRERELNDEEAMKAARFLRENWIPSFVRALDNMEIRPFDSLSFTTELHKKGINVRYLGFICKTCTIPFVRTMATVEMVARVCKQLFQTKLRGAILHFRSVGATAIEDQMNTYTANLLSTILGFSDRTAQFLETKIRPELRRKFDFDISAKEYAGLPRSGLFLAIQHHCGLSLEDHTEYDFHSDTCISKSRLIGFEPRVKTLTGTQVDIFPGSGRDESKLAYVVARHFKSLGPKSKLSHINSSAAILTFVASHYNQSSRFEEARLYAQAASASAQKNHALFGLATAQLLYAVAGLQTTGLSAPEPSLLGWYGKALSILSWHWGAHNPLTMTLLDRMSSIYHRAKDPQRAFDFHMQSLDVAVQTLGNNHGITAGYLARAGCYMGSLGKVDDAVKLFTQALNIFTSSRADPSLIAEVHYHYADALAQKGDYDRAVDHAQKCRKMRESCFGFTDVRVIHSCRQVAKLLLAPYKDYKGVLAPVVKAAYREAISCHEKVFRYLQNVQGASSRRKSMRRSLSRMSFGSISHTTTSHPAAVERLSMAGPLVVAPFGWTPPFAKNLLHRLTKEIVAMKLALVEVPAQKECIRMLRAKLAATDDFDDEDAKSIVLRMAAVTPSVYLDDVLQRISLGDECGVHELGLILILTESETVGIRT
ncbi:hypothetical protein HDU91_002046 [Kappamyces sp. JEL0680]|nr:hypothetical protein HDU91_002046 [Kappamyces sp. JEL0680]